MKYLGVRLIWSSATDENEKTNQKTVLKITPNGSDYTFINAGDISYFTAITAENEYFLLGVDSENKRIFEVVKSGLYLGSPTKKLWRSKSSDFGITARIKRLSRLSFYANGECKVTVSCENGSRVFDVEGQGRVIIKPNLNGNIFTFEISSEEEEIEVSGLTLTFSYYL